MFSKGLGDSPKGVKPIADMFKVDPALAHVKWVLPSSYVLRSTTPLNLLMNSILSLHSSTRIPYVLCLVNCWMNQACPSCEGEYEYRYAIMVSLRFVDCTVSVFSHRRGHLSGMIYMPLDSMMRRMRKACSIPPN